MKLRASSPLAFALVLAAVAGFKLWLVHDEEIVGSATQYDALWYVRSAHHWYWGATYDWIAFIRPCAYPLWIASVRLLHIPLRLAIELLQLGGGVILVYALRSLGIKRWLCAVSFAVMALHPAGYQLNDYTMSDTFYAAILWYVLGGFLLTWATRNRFVAVGTGVAMAVLWMTREEGLLLIAMTVVWATLSFLRMRRAAPAMRRMEARLVLTACLVAIALVLGVYTINYSVFRSFARSEMTAPTFESLFHSLLRIKTSQPQRYAPITAQALSDAFQVSPTFANLRPQLEGPLGASWQTETFNRVGVRNQIGAGWIVWATRESASRQGYFSSAKEARTFFRRAAREINRACDEGRLPARFVVDGFLDPLAQTGGVGALPHSARRVGARFFARWSMRSLGDDDILTPAEASLYDEMTQRRSAGVPSRNGAAFLCERFLGRRYLMLSVGLHLLAGLAVCALFWRERGGKGVAHFRDAILLLGSAVFFRSALFTWLDATAFDGTEDRFLFPVLSLWMVVLLLTTGWAFAAAPPRPAVGRDPLSVP